jgi:hypothetical protein
MPATSGAFKASVGGRWVIRRSLGSGRTAQPARRRVDRPGRVVAVGLGLIAVFGTGLLLSGYVPFSLRSTMESGLRHDDEFGRTRVGDVLFATGQGNACRKVQFHNNTGLFGPDLTVRCDTGLPDDQTADGRRNGGNSGSGRLMSVRDAFIHR